MFSIRPIYRGFKLWGEIATSRFSLQERWIITLATENCVAKFYRSETICKCCCSSSNIFDTSWVALGQRTTWASTKAFQTFQTKKRTTAPLKQIKNFFVPLFRLLKFKSSNKRAAGVIKYEQRLQHSGHCAGLPAWKLEGGGFESCRALAFFTHLLSLTIFRNAGSLGGAS